MSHMNRRTVLRLLGAAPVAAGFAWTDAAAREASGLARAAQSAAAAGVAFVPQFFTEHEWATVRVLVDLIIPRDERSGSATDAGVPEFMDFIMMEQPWAQVPMRGGLAWLDVECQERFDRTFLDCDAVQRTAVLDDIAWPDGRPGGAPARPELAHGIAFFSSFRDLTATGFWTSKMGFEDLRYIGNTYVKDWTGCPEDALKRLGVKYTS